MDTEEVKKEVVAGVPTTAGGDRKGKGGRRVAAKVAEVVVGDDVKEGEGRNATKCSSNKSPRKRQVELSSATPPEDSIRLGLRSRNHPAAAHTSATTAAGLPPEESPPEEDSSPERSAPTRSLRSRKLKGSGRSDRVPGSGGSDGNKSPKSHSMKIKANSCDNAGGEAVGKLTAAGIRGEAERDSIISRNISTNFSTLPAKIKDAGTANSNAAQNKRKVLSFAEAPSYLKFNPYITGGYRTALTPRDCVRSLFWWTNETLNIWSHLLGWMFFVGLSIYDSMGLVSLPHTHPWDRAIVVILLIAFQACMLLSALYHVFCCCSEKFYRRWLSADLFGVSLSLLAIYISGIYYAFSCVPIWLNFYLVTVGAIFVSAMVLQIIPVVKKPTTAEAFHWRLVVFGGWAAYGIVPTLHWAVLHGGTSSPVVSLLLPRIFAMYGISIAAFFFYVLRVPEKLYPGLVNFIGSSHQIWHVLIVVAFYHWHNTGIMYLQFRANNLCQDEYAFLYSSPAVEQPVEAK